LPDLLTELRDDGALWLTFNRPDVLNAFSAELAGDLAEHLERATGRDEVRAVVLTGAGSAFSAGADISGADAADRFDVRSMDAADRIVRAVTGCAKPVLAAVNGVAAGVGCSTALAADLVVAAEGSSFLLAFARIGLMPDGGTSATVAASIGRARAMRMALLGEPLTAQEAYDAGLVSHLAPAEGFDAVVERVVGQLVRGAPLAQAATKKAVNAATLDQLEPALDRERSGQPVLMRTHDFAEGVRAFGERRRPEFRGD
jgi:enoyl-CoA hydratase